MLKKLLDKCIKKIVQVKNIIRTRLLLKEYKELNKNSEELSRVIKKLKRKRMK
jgi:hypothetical protein|tara:strand:+ start:432 stop:590 length:159 start_codon:yes stop_codon:yes gene_type:complete